MKTPRRDVPMRKDDLVVQEMGDGLMIYDPDLHRAHSLNRTAALVFKRLDGKSDIRDVSRHVGKALGRAQSEQIVSSAVNKLGVAGLLRPGAPFPRRSMLRGLAAGLLPVVVSIAVPPAANAQSGFPLGDSCLGGSECASGECASGFCCETSCLGGVCDDTGNCTGTANGAPCTASDQCASGLCSAGICVAP
jgi:hypothetical protein